MILVSHDPHLVGLVADRLWLVKDGAVTPWEDDLDAYARFLLGRPAPKVKEKADKPKPPSRDEIKALRAEVSKCEARVAKLEEMKAKVDARMADPKFYMNGDSGDFETWQRRHADVTEGLERAEALWMAALEKLEAAEARS